MLLIQDKHDFSGHNLGITLLPTLRKDLYLTEIYLFWLHQDSPTYCLNLADFIPKRFLYVHQQQDLHNNNIYTNVTSIII